VANRIHLERATGITGQLPGHEVTIGEDFVVVIADGRGGAERTPARIVPQGAGYEVAIAGRNYRIELRSNLRDIVVRGTSNDHPFVAQIERLGLPYRVSHHGAQIDARVLSPRAAELHALMPFKAPPDLSKFLLSPMPGLLADVAVQVGQAVRAGERLAVIEAMKMENILVAAQDGTVAEVAAAKGESVAVDQVILRFA
jgi:propionyl-CoA carboxylase alpha chain